MFHALALHQNAYLCLFQFLSVTSSALLKVKRTYVLCANTKFIVGVLDPETFQLSGGGFPLALSNPNVHIMCQVPGTCIFEGYAPTILSLPNTTLLAAFLKLQNSPPLPASYRIDTSNLLIEGLVFRGISVSPGANGSEPIVGFAGFGHAMTIKNCLWTQANASSAPTSALTILRPEKYGLSNQGRGSVYTSLLLDNCTFRDNVFSSAVVVSFPDIPNLTVPCHKVALRNSVFERNTILNQFRNASGTFQASGAALIDFRHSITNLTNVMINNNTIAKTRAAIVLINSYFSYSNLRFRSNVILERRGLNCTDVARVTRFRNKSDVGGYSVRATGCIEFDSNGVVLKPPTRMPTVKPPPTRKPTRRPSTTRPTRRPTTFSPNMFSPVEST